MSWVLLFKGPHCIYQVSLNIPGLKNYISIHLNILIIQDKWFLVSVAFILCDSIRQWERNSKPVLPYKRRSWVQFYILQTVVPGHPVDWDHTQLTRPPPALQIYDYMGGKHSNTRTNYIHIAPSSAHQSLNNVKDFVFHSAGTQASIQNEWWMEKYYEINLILVHSVVNKENTACWMVDALSI